MAWTLPRAAKFALTAAVCVALAFSFSCETDDEDGGGGDGVGCVTVKNSFLADLVNVKLTTSKGDLVGSDSRIGSGGSRSFSNVPHSLITMTYGVSGQSGTDTHKFTLQSGERVTLELSKNGNWLTTRKKNGCGGTNDDPGAVGRIKITNSSGYALINGMISHNNKLVVDVGSMEKGGSWTYRDIPVGSCKVYFARTSGSYYYHWETYVNVTEGNTSSVTVTSSDWTR